MTIQEHLVSTLILMQVQVSALEDLEKVLPREDFEKIKTSLTEENKALESQKIALAD